MDVIFHVACIRQAPGSTLIYHLEPNILRLSAAYISWVLSYFCDRFQEKGKMHVSFDVKSSITGAFGSVDLLNNAKYTILCVWPLHKERWLAAWKFLKLDKQVLGKHQAGANFEALGKN